MKRSAVFSVIFIACAIASAILMPSIAAQTPAPTQLSNQPLTLQDLNILLRRAVGRNMTEADLDNPLPIIDKGVSESEKDEYGRIK